ncbi:MAG: ABC transporter permease [Candidatus Kaiserbacteria bacterium]|nr:ABC transporter permease [Candidatus Kaiserbacteria bacterium]
MNVRRIYAVLLQEVFLTVHSLEVIMDVFLFPTVNIVIFGLLAVYLSGTETSETPKFFFLGMLLWQVVGITSYSVAVGSMWNIWSRNLSNMFIAPLRVSEYVSALFLSGCAKAIMLLALGMGLSAWLFDFNVLEVGFPALALAFVIFAFFGFALAILTIGIIFRFGTRLAALSWSLPWLFQPLSAAFFPISALPHAMQLIAKALAPTYAFEMVRYSLAFHSIRWDFLGWGLALDFLYCIVFTVAFQYLYERSRDSGQFAKNES